MIIKKLKNKEGNALILGVAIALGLFIIMSGVLEYLRLKTLTSHVEDSLQSSVINVSIENYENIYSSNREGYVSGNLYKNGRWEEIIDKGNIYEQMADSLGLEKEGEEYTKYSDGEVEYTVSNLRFKVKAPPIRSSANNKLIIESTVEFEIPHAFGWEKLPPLSLRLKTKSEHMIMF